MDLKREYNNIYSLHENQIKKWFYSTGVDIVSHSRLRGIEVEKSPILGSVLLADTLLSSSKQCSSYGTGLTCYESTLYPPFNIPT
jgi:hypothetical protein